MFNDTVKTLNDSFLLHFPKLVFNFFGEAIGKLTSKLGIITHNYAVVDSV